MRYRRAAAAGGTYCFTVNLAARDADTLVRHIDDLREVMRQVKAAHPFAVVAMVVLPEHLHAIWRLPAGDADYPTRWALLKAGFARRVAASARGARRNASGASGSGGIGNTKSGMRPTWRGTWITSISIR